MAATPTETSSRSCGRSRARPGAASRTRQRSCRSISRPSFAGGGPARPSSRESEAQPPRLAQGYGPAPANHHAWSSRPMAPTTRRLAGILLVLFPAVALGGASLLTMIVGDVPGYLDNQVRQDLWRAGHAHAGIMLILALVLLRYVDETSLRGPWLWLARLGAPAAAILMPLGFFLSVLSPTATEPNALIALVPLGGVCLVVG